MKLNKKVKHTLAVIGASLGIVAGASSDAISQNLNKTSENSQKIRELTSKKKDIYISGGDDRLMVPSGVNDEIYNGKHSVNIENNRQGRNIIKWANIDKQIDVNELLNSSSEFYKTIIQESKNLPPNTTIYVRMPDTYKIKTDKKTWEENEQYKKIKIGDTQVVLYGGYIGYPIFGIVSEILFEKYDVNIVDSKGGMANIFNANYINPKTTIKNSLPPTSYSYIEFLLSINNKKTDFYGTRADFQNDYKAGTDLKKYLSPSNGPKIFTLNVNIVLKNPENSNDKVTMNK